MKIQPIDFNLPDDASPAAKPAVKSRFKRLFERQFSSALRVPPPPLPLDKPSSNRNKDEFEPSSACLARMVQNFIEESSEKPQHRCDRKRCNCFNGTCTDNSDDESDGSNSSSSDAHDLLKSLVPCLHLSERNLLADTAKIIDRNKISKRKDELSRKLVTDGLISVGYNASICKSKWEKSPSIPSGEYEYIDVIIEGERYLIDLEFRSEFEVARATKAYRSILETLPSIFVGQSDRLSKMISIVSEAGRQSLNKKGMHFPPWRKADYVKAKWLSPFIRINPVIPRSLTIATPTNPISGNHKSGLFFEKGSIMSEEEVFIMSESEDELL